MAEPPKFTYIRDVGPGLRNINIQFIVLDISVPRKTKDGHDIRTVRVSDKSGSINLAVWDEIGDCLQPGDICRLLNGYVSIHKLCLTLNCGKLGEVQKVGEFCMLFSDTPFMSLPNPEYAKPTESPYQKPPAGSNGGGGGPPPTGNGTPENNASAGGGHQKEGGAGGPVAGSTAGPGGSQIQQQQTVLSSGSDNTPVVGRNDKPGRGRGFKRMDNFNQRKFANSDKRENLKLRGCGTVWKRQAQRQGGYPDYKRRRYSVESPDYSYNDNSANKHAKGNKHFLNENCNNTSKACNFYNQRGQRRHNLQYRYDYSNKRWRYDRYRFDNLNKHAYNSNFFDYQIPYQNMHYNFYANGNNQYQSMQESGAQIDNFGPKIDNFGPKIENFGCTGINGSNFDYQRPFFEPKNENSPLVDVANGANYANSNDVGQLTSDAVTSRDPDSQAPIPSVPVGGWFRPVSIKDRK